MQKTMGSSRREVAVRLSHRSIGEGRKDKIRDEGDANIDDEDGSAALLLLLLSVVLLDVDPLGREPAGGNCECSSGETGGRCSSSDACPARSKFERAVAIGRQIFVFSRISREERLEGVISFCLSVSLGAAVSCCSLSGF